MKVFKMVLNCVLPTVLVFSIVLNILLLCGFEFTKPKLNNSYQQSQVVTLPNPTEKETYREQPSDLNDYSGPSVQITEDPQGDYKPASTLIYEDDNITITYLTVIEDSNEIVHLFNVKNNSKKTLSVITSELYLNGQRVYVSGLTCEKLLPDMNSDEELVLLNKEWSQFTNYPSKISFKLKLVNDKSRLDLYETDLINLDFNN